MTNLLQTVVESNMLPAVTMNKYLYCKDIPEYSRDFIAYIEKIKRFSPNTVITYSRALERFNHYITTIEEEVVRVRVVRAFMANLVDKGYSATSINLHLATLRSFHRYCLKNELLKESPAKTIPQLRKPKRLPKYLTEQEVIDVLEKPFSKSFAGVRDNFIIEMLYGTGCRLNELINIKEKDISTKNYVKVMGKGSKERIIPMHSKLVELYKIYMRKRKSYLKKNTSKYIFINKKGEKLYPMFIQRVIKKHFGHITRISMHPHLLRHSFATHLLNRGANMIAISQLLGHSSMASTCMYTHVQVNKLITQYSKVF